jgi:hypothetical protein
MRTSYRPPPSSKLAPGFNDVTLLRAVSYWRRVKLDLHGLGIRIAEIHLGAKASRAPFAIAVHVAEARICYPLLDVAPPREELRCGCASACRAGALAFGRRQIIRLRVFTPSDLPRTVA